MLTDQQKERAANTTLAARFHRATGAGIRVAVIDSGWDSHLNEPHVEQGISFVDLDDHPIQSADTEDALGHGTACIDLVLQTAPDVRVVPVRIFGRKLFTTTTILAQAIRWAASQQIDVINLSLGTIEPDAVRPLYAACEFARRQGSIVVAAVNRIEQASYPAIFDNTIGVGVIDAPNLFYYQPNEAIEFLTCGRQRARWLGGLLLPVDGTSFAAPVAAGIIARVLELFPKISLTQLHQKLATIASQIA